METECLAHPASASCSVVNATPPRGAVVIGRSVGAGGVNRADDARTIQSALNAVSADRGGASPALVVDGVVGPLTRAAIKRFQQRHVKVVDSRIDPNGATLSAVNAELDGGDVAATPAPGLVTAPARPRTPEFLPPDPAINALVLDLLVRVRDLIRAADFRLVSADPFVTTRKLTSPAGPFNENARRAIEMLDVTFGLGKFANPRPPFENIKRVFRNMDVALNRTFETDPQIAPVLFVPNTHISMESKAAAYTSAGGAFVTSKVKFRGLAEPADRIYICRNALTVSVLQQVRIMVHELAHFVSGQPITIGDEVKEFSMLTERAAFDAISHERKLRSAEHYAFFAVVARFPQFLKPPAT